MPLTYFDLIHKIRELEAEFNYLAVVEEDNEKRTHIENIDALLFELIKTLGKEPLTNIATREHSNTLRVIIEKADANPEVKKDKAFTDELNALKRVYNSTKSKTHVSKFFETHRMTIDIDKNKQDAQQKRSKKNKWGQTP